MRALAVLLLPALAACDSKPDSPAAPVTLYVASSLKEAVTDIADQWSGRTGRSTLKQFEATSTLARQINEGAPADLFITASPEWLDQVKTLERFDWLSNRLVCVVRKETKDFDVRTVDSLALAGDQVPAGKYARQALGAMGIRIPERTLYGQNVRDVLSKVAHGGAQAGIVYATDAVMDPNVRVAYTFPPESHDRILYSVGLIRSGGKALFDALKEPASIDVAKRYGFVDLK